MGTDDKGGRGRLVLLLAAAVGVTWGVASVLVDVMEKKQEATAPFFRVVELTEEIDDPEVWGQNFPLQYDDYLKTVDMERTRFGGSEAVPREPTEDDPRPATSRSKIEMIPDLKRMWAGYAFAIDYREKRGHAYMLVDQQLTDRQTKPQVGTCINCHASTVKSYLEVGNGDMVAGFEALNPLPYEEALKHFDRAIACIDCHDPETMALRITRPAFTEGIAAAKAAEGIENYDVNTMATRQEMRSYVCGQCHVEYYFHGEGKRLVFPWHNGLSPDGMLDYYDEIGFKDWTHAETGAPMLKAQHPEFELWSQGIHARAGVACADCHMPYRRVGAAKISDHHVRSPLLNVNRACQTCHNVPEDELIARVETIQGRTEHLSEMALSALVDFIDEIKAAREAGATDEQLAEVLNWQRRASFFVDYIESENSSGLHADQEAARILAESIEATRKGQLALRDLVVGGGLVAAGAGG